MQTAQNSSGFMNILQDKNPIDVSIVIVCMNNLKNLYPCLKSIRKYTTEITYETLVVAYLFTEENLKKVKLDFPWVTFIESNEIRGFSENNNLALRQASGKYCFVLNDDTEMKMPVVDMLIETIEGLPNDVAVVSPKSIFGDGSLQSCGRPEFTITTAILRNMMLWDEQKTKSPYVNQQGIFQTYHLWGAFFLIKTKIFKEMGWFDERYFFSSEDVDLSRKINRAGYRCYVNADVVITHYEGMTGKGVSMLQLATKPAGYKGSIIFYGDGSKLRTICISIIFFIFLIPQFIYHVANFIIGKDKVRNGILAQVNINCMKITFLSITPKEAFMRFSKGLI